jgi:predicted CopG family antitoxin
MFKYMFKHNYFGCLFLTKTITIRDEVYKKLLKIKHEGESFSELFERLVEDTSSIETLKRLRGCVEFKDKDKMLSEIYEGRAERRL